MPARNASKHLIALLALAALGACAAQVSDVGGQPAAQNVAVGVTPSEAALATGQAAQFAAAVTGTADTAVTWQVDEAGGGQVDQAGLYTAPGSAGTFHVRAVSRANSSASAAATITVSIPPPGSVVISPKTVTLASGGTQAFTATVTNLSSSAATWKLQESSGCGSVTSAGVYTAPAGPATCHVVATSVADPTRSDVATVTVSAPVVVTVAVSPATITMDACTSTTFKATVSGSSDQAVTWSVAEGSAGGAVTSAGAYTAPSSAGTYHLVATSHASSSSTGTATVTVKDHVLSVAVSPQTVTLGAGGTQQFTATVTTTCGTFAAASP
jgi:hypothetical protein